MEIKKGKLLTEGSTKKLYSTNDPNVLVMHFKDEVSSLTGKNLVLSRRKALIAQK